MAINSLNHELSSPGSEIKVAINCDVTSKNSLLFASKVHVFNVSIVDRNDNQIRVQDKRKDVELSSPYFKKVRKANYYFQEIFNEFSCSG